jgi:type II secretory pathway pseudopilin PulG
VISDFLHTMTNDPIPPSSKRFPYVETILVIALLVVLAGMSAPVVLKSKKSPDRTEALNNIRQIGVALFEFESDYGSFPDDATAIEVRKRTGTDFKLSGEFSNDYFRQLIARGLKSEKPFWCKTSFSPKKPDDNFKSAAKALEAGEVGYSYIMASKTKGQDSSGDPGRPVVAAPSYQARADWSFDPEPYGEKALVLKLDNSATAMNVRVDNKFISTGVAGRYLQTIGDNTPWGSDANPILRAPQPKGR